MTEVEGSIVRHIHRLTMIHIIYLIYCDVINVGVFCFRYVHEGIRYFNWFIVLTFEFCVMAFFAQRSFKNRRRKHGKLLFSV